MAESKDTERNSPHPATRPVPEAGLGNGGPMPQHLSEDEPELDAVDAASADSFPASDPVSSPSIVGATVPRDPSAPQR
jgi:hypothetical protein